MFLHPVIQSQLIFYVFTRNGEHKAPVEETYWRSGGSTEDVENYDVSGLIFKGRVWDIRPVDLSSFRVLLNVTVLKKFYVHIEIR